MTNRIRNLVLFLTLPMASMIAQAHPGHGAGDIRSLFAGPFSGLEHLLAWTVVAISIGLLLRRAKRVKTSAAYGWAGAGIVAGAVLISLT